MTGNNNPSWLRRISQSERGKDTTKTNDNNDNPSWLRRLSSKNNNKDDEETMPLFGSKTGEKNSESYGSTVKWDKQKDETNDDEKDNLEAQLESDDQLILRGKPRKNCCLHVFHFIEAISIIASLCLFISQILPLIYAESIIDDIGLLRLAIRVYMSFLCLIIILIEFDLPLIHKMTISSSYLLRGLCYVFIGLIAMEESIVVSVNDMQTGQQQTQYDVSWAVIFIEAAAWSMIGVGCIYVLFGLCCMKRLRSSLLSSYDEELKNYNEAMQRARRRQQGK